MCPTCTLYYIGVDSATGSDLLQGVFLALSVADVVSTSWFIPEFDGEQNYCSNLPPGKVLTAFAGEREYGPVFPAACGEATAVGGTSLYLKKNFHRQSESVMNNTGGGCSMYVPKPTWQNDSDCSMRMIADVAAVQGEKQRNGILANFPIM